MGQGNTRRPGAARGKPRGSYIVKCVDRASPRPGFTGKVGGVLAWSGASPNLPHKGNPATLTPMATPPPRPADVPAVFRAGTLVYDAAGLRRVFAWLLGAE